MTPDQRREIEEALQTSSARVCEMLETRSPEELTHRPAPDSWSAAECVAHLALTSKGALPALEAVVAGLRARGLTTDRPSRMDWLGWLLRRALEPPPRFKTRTATPFQPLDVAPVSEVRSAFLDGQARLVRVLRDAEGLDLSRSKVTSPFDRRIRDNAYSMLRILETHERRHLWQAERALP